eukprot:PhM_4_TR18709/c1_g1_i1/m.7845
MKGRISHYGDSRPRSYLQSGAIMDAVDHSFMQLLHAVNAESRDSTFDAVADPVAWIATHLRNTNPKLISGTSTVGTRTFYGLRNNSHNREGVKEGGAMQVCPEHPVYAGRVCPPSQLAAFFGSRVLEGVRGVTVIVVDEKAVLVDKAHDRVVTTAVACAESEETIATEFRLSTYCESVRAAAAGQDVDVSIVRLWGREYESRMTDGTCEAILGTVHPNEIKFENGGHAVLVLSSVDADCVRTVSAACLAYYNVRRRVERTLRDARERERHEGTTADGGRHVGLLRNIICTNTMPRPLEEVKARRKLRDQLRAQRLRKRTAQERNRETEADLVRRSTNDLARAARRVKEDEMRELVAVFERGKAAGKIQALARGFSSRRTAPTSPARETLTPRFEGVPSVASPRGMTSEDGDVLSASTRSALADDLTEPSSGTATLTAPANPSLRTAHVALLQHHLTEIDSSLFLPRMSAGHRRVWHFTQTSVPPDDDYDVESEAEEWELVTLTPAAAAVALGRTMQPLDVVDDALALAASRTGEESDVEYINNAASLFANVAGVQRMATRMLERYTEMTLFVAYMCLMLQKSIPREDELRAAGHVDPNLLPPSMPPWSAWIRKHWAPAQLWYDNAHLCMTTRDPNRKGTKPILLDPLRDRVLYKPSGSSRQQQQQQQQQQPPRITGVRRLHSRLPIFLVDEVHCPIRLSIETILNATTATSTADSCVVWLSMTPEVVLVPSDETDTLVCPYRGIGWRAAGLPTTDIVNPKINNNMPIIGVGTGAAAPESVTSKKASVASKKTTKKQKLFAAAIESCASMTPGKDETQTIPCGSSAGTVVMPSAPGQQCAWSSLLHSDQPAILGVCWSSLEARVAEAVNYNLYANDDGVLYIYQHNEDSRELTRFDRKFRRGEDVALASMRSPGRRRITATKQHSLDTPGRMSMPRGSRDSQALLTSIETMHSPNTPRAQFCMRPLSEAYNAAFVDARQQNCVRFVRHVVPDGFGEARWRAVESWCVYVQQQFVASGGSGVLVLGHSSLPTVLGSPGLREAFFCALATLMLFDANPAVYESVLRAHAPERFTVSRATLMQRAGTPQPPLLPAVAAGALDGAHYRASSSMANPFKEGPPLRGGKHHHRRESSTHVVVGSSDGAGTSRLTDDDFEESNEDEEEVEEAEENEDGDSLCNNNSGVVGGVDDGEVPATPPPTPSPPFTHIPVLERLLRELCAARRASPEEEDGAAHDPLPPTGPATSETVVRSSMRLVDDVFSVLAAAAGDGGGCGYVFFQSNDGSVNNKPLRQRLVETSREMELYLTIVLFAVHLNMSGGVASGFVDKMMLRPSVVMELSRCAVDPTSMGEDASEADKSVAEGRVRWRRATCVSKIV